MRVSAPRRSLLPGAVAPGDWLVKEVRSDERLTKPVFLQRQTAKTDQVYEASHALAAALDLEAQSTRSHAAACLHPSPGEGALMTNMLIYLIGTLLVVAGLAYGASRVGVSQVWIVAGALVIIGLGLMGGIVKTRQKDPAS